MRPLREEMAASMASVAPGCTMQTAAGGLRCSSESVLGGFGRVRQPRLAVGTLPGDKGQDSDTSPTPSSSSPLSLKSHSRPLSLKSLQRAASLTLCAYTCKKLDGPPATVKTALRNIETTHPSD